MHISIYTRTKRKYEKVRTKRKYEKVLIMHMKFDKQFTIITQWIYSNNLFINSDYLNYLYLQLQNLLLSLIFKWAQSKILYMFKYWWQQVTSWFFTGNRLWGDRQDKVVTLTRFLYFQRLKYLLYPNSDE